MNPPPADVAVIGAGPAGLALAAELVGRGARVVVIDPDPERPWTPTWCAFHNDLPSWAPVERTWARAVVELPGRTVTLERPYVQIDNQALQQALTARSDAAVRVVGAVVGIAPDGVRLATGQQIAADRVVDCSGGGSPLNPTPPRAFQTAWGLEIVTDGHPWDPQVATWMDLRDLAPRPSFLYALPVDAEVVFVEETALAARPEMPLDELEARLARRLARLGVAVRAIRRVERCRIPLDVKPAAGLAFGVAAGMVHPATGFLLARVLACAGDVAEGILAGRGEAAITAARGGRARALHLLGLEVLLGSDGPALSAFFTTFFDASPTTREAFLAVRPTVGPTALAMARLFAAAPASVRYSLAAPLWMGMPGLRSSREVPCPNP